MNEISRGTIFENLWAGHKTYFVYDHTKISRNQPKIAIGCEIINLDGKWIFGKNACYYKKDLLDNEHFPIVGQVDLEEMIIRGILNAIKDYANRKYSWDTFAYSEYAGAVYFPTKDIAQKVCDILNKEFESKK